jgi:glycosyltransferase involved in cell wall biosynthesis
MTAEEHNNGTPPAVSVIIPAYRVTEYIAETLDSVLAQTFTDYEIILVNDGCPDTPALERVLEPYRARIVYIKQANCGLAAARNTAIRASRAPLVALLDGDDAWEPDYLEHQIGMMRADPTIDILYPNAVIIGDTPHAGRMLMDFSPSEGEVTFAKLARLECVVTVSVVAKREVLERAGLFNPALRRVEDFELWLRVAAAGGRIAYHRKPLLRYRRRATSLSADSAAMRRVGLEVLERLGRTLSLEESQRRGLEEGCQRFQADVAYFEAQQALAEGDASRAWQGYRNANRYFRRPKLSLAWLALRWFPKLALVMARQLSSSH